MPYSDQLSLRKMRFEDITYDDDYLVMWRGIAVGRILKQTGIPMGKPAWFWGINFDARPQTEAMRGMRRDLTECQQAFRDAWEIYRPQITEADFERVSRRR